MESNKLIAEFMDLSTEVDGLYLLPNGLCEEELMGLGSMISIDEMLYHKSWSWLMKVVDKIEGFQDGKDGDSIRGHLYNFRIEQICAYIIDGGSSDIIISVDGDNKRDATYNAVVEFIKWYNKSKEPTVNAQFDEEDMWINCPHCDNTEQQPVDQQRHHLQSLPLLDWESEKISKHQCLLCDGLFKVNWESYES